MGMDEQVRPDKTGFRVNRRVLAQVPDGEEHREVADQRFVIRRSRVQLPPPAPELADLHRVCLSSMPIGDVEHRTSRESTAGRIRHTWGRQSRSRSRARRQKWSYCRQ